MVTILVYFAAACVMSLALTPICRAIAQRTGHVAKPSDDRWHKKPTALFGGVAIAVGTLVIGASIAGRAAHAAIWQLIACGGLIGAFGLFDDLLSLKPSTKLVAQIAIASLLLFFGYRVHWTPSLVTDAMLTVFWIVGVTNAFNLLDNMDGLCAGTAIIAGSFLLVGIVSNSGVTAPALYLSALLGSTAGFLAYNVHPASIFMGDTGSLFIGTNLAALTLVAREGATGRSGMLSIVAIPVFLLLVPIFDTTLVTALRLLAGRRPSQGGRDHASHRLVAVGLSEARAVAVLWMLSAAGGGIAVMLQLRDPSWALILALALAIGMLIFAVYLARVRVYEDADLMVLRGEVMTPLVTQFMYKRRVAEVLLDLCLVPLAYYTAYRLRFEGPAFGVNYHLFLESMPVVLATQLIALFIVGGYRGTWRYFGMMDAVVFAKGVLLGTVAAEMIILYVYRFQNYSRSVFIIYAAVLLLLLAGTRASFRLLGEFVNRRQSTGQRCVIYGTSGASLATIREAFGAASPLKLVGYIDDDPAHRRLRVSGYPVVGGYDELLDLLARREVDCVVLNAPLVDVDRLQRLESECRAHEIDLLRLQVHLKPLSAAS